MSSIAGVITFQPAGDLEERLADLRPYLGCGQSRHRSHVTVIRGGGLISTASVRGGQDPSRAIGKDGEIIAGFIGQPMTSEGVERGESASTSDLSGARADLLCRMYRRAGPDFVHALRGSFSLAVWDPAAQRVVLATDPLGTRPLYYAFAGQRLIFASDARALLGDAELPRCTDEHTLAEYLSLGFPLEDRTLVESIRLVAPGTVVTVTAGRLESTRYFDPVFEYEPGGEQAFEEQFCERFLHAVKTLSRQDGIYALPLSGGLDSRCIAVALWRCGRQAETFTIGTDQADDLHLAQQVADRLGFPHNAYRLTPQDFLGWVEEGVRLTDGMLSAFDTHILFVARQLPVGTRAVFDGISCSDSLYSGFEVPLGGIAPDRVEPRLVGRLFIDPLVQPWRPAFDSDGLFSESFRPVAEQHVWTSLNEVAATAQGHSPFDRLDLADLRQRIRRYNFAGSVILNAYAPVRCPFFHPGVLDVALRLPPPMRAREKPMERRLVQRLAPQLNDIPWERSGLSPAAGKLRMLLRHGERKLAGLCRRLLPGWLRRVRHARSGVAIDYARWLRESRELQAFVRDVLLSRTCLQRGYYSEPSVRSLVEDHISGRADRIPLLGRMLSVELWHRNIMNASPPRRDRRVHPESSRFERCRETDSSGNLLCS